MDQDNRVILEVKDLTKRFPGTIAVNKVCMDVYANEVHAIIGENGAGKSTICKMLTGLYTPDEGTITFMGKKVAFRSTSEAMHMGINMVYQERNLISHLTGAQNIMLGSEPKKGILLDEKKIRQMAKEISKRIGIDVPLDTPVSSLTAGVQQSIEILRAFTTNPKLLILDEPTASLGESEIVPFLNFIKAVKHTANISIIFISHKLDEVFMVADRISVFTEGVKVMTVKTQETTRSECIKAMLKNGNSEPVVIKHTIKVPRTVLRVGKATYDGKEHKLDFHVDEGEVVGFYGLVGAGRTECVQALYGLRRITNADVEFNGEKIEKFSNYDMVRRGMSMTPEIRKAGMFRDYSLMDNIAIMFMKQFRNRLHLIDNRKKNEFALRVLENNRVKYASPEQKISSLSGGNIQKIIIGRSIASDRTKLLILDEPTNGLDLGAKYDVYVKARSLAEDSHKAVLFISSEIDEILSVCNRCYVFAFGNIVQEFAREEFDKQRILEAAFRRG